MYQFALNPTKLERAIKLAGSTEPADVYEKYVLLGGKVDESQIPGAKKEKTLAKATTKPYVSEPISSYTPVTPKLTNIKEESKQDTSHTTG